MTDNIQNVIERFQDDLIYLSQSFREFIPGRITKGLSLEQHKIIKILAEEGPLQNSELTQLLKIDKGVVSEKVKRLEQLGLVQKANHKTDKRKVQISLTENGTAIFNKFNEDIQGFVGEVLKIVEVDELEKFFSVLLRIVHLNNRYDRKSSGKGNEIELLKEVTLNEMKRS
ncbi:MarR family winged helix-turn-helix transcriptional regulator [Paenibacillus beijingensis]|uniref:MarR family winged helix-turn-helix transcriptional regulator n=1 Tax=Paenibacillus beijingensis TaxID=1126833 RepID=UPI000698ACAA|nr:MarR family transcriptional regulator [Paenibacillus beijingensis]